MEISYRRSVKRRQIEERDCARMAWGCLVVLLLHASLGGQQRVKGDQVSDFLDEKERQVLQIANLSQENYENTCDLVASCSLPSECSRGACSPLLSDNLTCTYVAENANCHVDPSDNTSSTCTSIRANFERSYVRTPRGLLSGASNEVPSEMRNSICSQRRLDPLFRELQMLQNSSQYFFNFYFGAIDGSFRAYPGVEVYDCFRYDPRIRPWYTGAISVVKDLVVLLDTGSTMSDSLALATFEASTLQAAQNTTQQLLKTITRNDRASVVSFNNSAQATLLNQSYIVPDAGLNLSDPGFNQLLFTLNSTRPSNSNNGPSASNITAALNQAMSIFDTNPLSDALKIIVLITNGRSSPNVTELASVMRRLREEPIKLLIYDLGASNSALGALACGALGSLEKLNSVTLLENPLFAVSSYFTLLARSQQDTPDGSRPIWNRVYTDYGNLGNVITVAFTVMSADGSQLVGVVGIDIQIQGMGVSFRSAVDNDVVRSRRYEISNNSNGANISDCQPINNQTQSQCNSDFATPLCIQDDRKSSYASLVCCAHCGIPGSLTSKDNSGTIVIASVTVGIVLAAAVLAVFFWYRFCKVAVVPSNFPDFVKIPKFSYESLSVATNRFCDANELGHGTFGTVYKGVLEDGTRVAIKKLFDQPKYGFRDFEAELKVLVTANHTNLVALRGFCIEQHHLLVYEFVENGDLDNWLFVKPERENKVLSWSNRVNIAKGMARGLWYLHEELQNRLKVFHSDIKPANILLDGEFNPKVADFGMSKLYNGGSEIFATGGTKGYIAPEILEGEPATTGTDVYSYGMVLLELVSGRKFCSIESLPLWASVKVDQKREFEVVDHHLGHLKEDDMEMAKRLIGIALQCTSLSPEQRPEMSAVVRMIDGFLAVESLPRLFHDNEISDVTSTFSVETGSLGFSTPRSEETSASRKSMNLLQRGR